MMFFLKFLTLLMLIISASYAIVANEVVWPIKEERIITSGFMEDRAFRYHAGVDFRTWGRQLPLYASEDGSVIRINISPWGYGKSVYIQGNSGKIYVYAHCSKFIPEIESQIRNTQIRRSRYRVDFQVDQGKIPIKKGQLIGYTGETGAGPPHLHFEIRDRHNRPLNPFNLGFSVLDTHPPVIASVSIFPIDDTTLINGDENIKIFDYSNKVDTAYISGRAGLSVLAWDLSSLNLNARLGVYDYKLYLNDSLAFHQKYDRYSYSDSKYARYDKNYYVPAHRMTRAGNLFMYKLNEASFYYNTKISYPDGIFNGNDLKEGVLAKIIVSDHAGNKRETSIFLKEDNSPESIKRPLMESSLKSTPYSPSIIPIIATDKSNDSKKLQLDGEKIFIPKNFFEDNSNMLLDSTGMDFSFLFNSVIISLVNNSTDHLFLYNEKGAFKLRPRPNSSNEYIMPYYAIGEKNRFLMLRKTVFGASFHGFFEKTFYKISKDCSYTINLDNRHSLEIKKNMVNRRESYFVIEEKNIVFNKDRFKGDENFRSFMPRGRAVDFNSGFTFSYKADAKEIDNFSIYTSGSRPRYVGGNLENGYITANMNINTSFLFVRDIISPFVQIRGVENGKFYNTKPNLSADVRDDESGIWSDTQIVTKVNNKIVINEYDPSRNRTRVLYPDRIITGRNTFSVSVTDNQGNTTTRKVEFYYKNR